jgi:tRNA A-37 threonylcarbamoyl transferase component Bud32
MLLQPEGQPIAVGRTAEIFEWDKGKVLKLFYDWYPLSAVEREAKIARIIYENGLPVPEFGDVLVFGDRLGMIFERIEGFTMDHHIHMNPLSSFKLVSQMVELQHQIHHCSASDLPFFSSFLSRGIRRTNALSSKVKSCLLGQLDRLSAEEDCLCHADYHPQNIILSNRGPVIVDWANAVSGDRLADVARTHYLLAEALAPGQKHIPATQKLFRKLLAAFYVHKYFRSYQGNKNDFGIWKTIIAAARLSENIPEERDSLLNTIRSGIEEYC